MGALHAGHEALIRHARATDHTLVVSIFVNPTQFGEGEDFERYPRTLDADLELCRIGGVDVVFMPSADEMYPEPLQTHVAVEPLGDDLIGAVRPGHFRGVATVVCKLFNIVQPDRAYFGRKDFQQLALIRRMVADLSFPITIVGVPTVREADGLALSSRNSRLDPDNRRASLVLHRALKHGGKMIEAGEREPETVLSAMRSIIEGEPLASLRSLDIRTARLLHPVERFGEESVVMLVTAQFGPVLLIDQFEAQPPSGKTRSET
ncbi:pantoate--beta-alanine ligase [Fulvimarina pelagi HTCC2506]|uniref:Pantothenate synthetase n=3 Tax=Fulvimarina pelagi TaxID=217511 RepID=Q0FZZ1_9HYPH|nr:pantoate--beta-alanine ligase [Fulvimarina pelagi HTCC2506]BAT31480.1 pantoate--beta-alanine ligase [Fulvimarina pelagi]